MSRSQTRSADPAPGVAFNYSRQEFSEYDWICSSCRKRNHTIDRNPNRRYYNGRRCGHCHGSQRIALPEVK
jgi:predicted SprT family Zn-dependent metalloprotease